MSCASLSASQGPCAILLLSLGFQYSYVLISILFRSWTLSSDLALEAQIASQRSIERPPVYKSRASTQRGLVLHRLLRAHFEEDSVPVLLRRFTWPAVWGVRVFRSWIDFIWFCKGAPTLATSDGIIWFDLDQTPTVSTNVPWGKAYGLALQVDTVCIENHLDSCSHSLLSSIALIHFETSPHFPSKESSGADVTATACLGGSNVSLVTTWVCLTNATWNYLKCTSKSTPYWSYWVILVCLKIHVRAPAVFDAVASADMARLFLLPRSHWWSYDGPRMKDKPVRSNHKHNEAVCICDRLVNRICFSALRTHDIFSLLGFCRAKFRGYYQKARP